LTINPKLFYTLSSVPYSSRATNYKFDIDNTGSLATGSYNQICIIEYTQNITSQLCRKSIKYDGDINSLKYNNRGLIAISTSKIISQNNYNYYVQLFNESNGSLVKTFTPRYRIDNLDFDNTNLLGGNSGDCIIVWNIKTGLFVETLSIKNISNKDNNLFSVVFDNQSQVFGGSRDDIFIFNSTTGILIDRLVGHSSGINFLKFDPTGLLVSGAADNTIRIWNTTNKTEIRKINIVLPNNKSNLNNQSFSIDNTGLVALGGTDNTNYDKRSFLQIYDYLTGNLVCEFSNPYIFRDRQLIVSRFDNKGLLISGDSYGYIELWDI